MATIDLGRVTPIFHGDYDNTATYELNDIVLYDGALYWHVSDTPTTGTDPTDATVWTLAMAYALDDVPTKDSQNAVKSGGVYTALQTVQDDIQDLQDAIDAANEKVLEAYPTDTASGPIASFPDGADNIPVKAMTVDIDLVQDLHGYDNPWPAGGGKNLYNAATFVSETRAGVTCTNNGDGSFTLNGTATAEVFFDIFRPQYATSVGGTPLPSAEYRLTGIPAGGGVSSYYMYTTPSYSRDTGSGETFTNTVTGGSLSVASGYTCNNIVVRPMLRLASNGDDTFAPYSNIAPISGWTGATVPWTGRNVWDEEWEVGGYDNATGAKTERNDRVRSKNYIPIKPSTAYYVKTSSSAFVVLGYDKDHNFTRVIQGLTASGVITANDKECYATFYYVDTTYHNDVSINYPSTDTAYHSGTDNTTFALDWSAAGTVYGGTAEYVGGGKWRVTKIMAGVDLGDCEWSYEATYFRSGSVNDIIKRPTTNAEVPNAICSCYKVVNWNTGAAHGLMWIVPTGQGDVKALMVKDTRYNDTTLSLFKAAVAGQTLAFELATPEIYEIDGPDPATLLGDNNIWADCGNVAVTYRADTALYIQKLLGA